MTEYSKKRYHQLLGSKTSRSVYGKGDYLDYCIMIAMTTLTLYGSYNYALSKIQDDLPSYIAPLVKTGSNLIFITGMICSLLMIITFQLRHGMQFRVPRIIAKPQELLYLIYYKLANIRYPFVLALLALGLESILIKFTPEWYHRIDITKGSAYILFFSHTIMVTIYRFAIFINHLIFRDHVQVVLRETVYRRYVKTKSSTILEIIQGFITGYLTHIITIAPWFLVITLADFSLIFLPITLFIGLSIESKFMMKLNEWYYRDHWLGHHSELDFIYLHGNHHDALPSAMMAVSGNGFLEGFLRYACGFPHALYNPLIAFFFKTFTVINDMNAHQYIPGLFPKLPKSKDMRLHGHHAAHHYGSLAPYGVGAISSGQDIKDDNPSKYLEIIGHSLNIDQQLNGYQKDNPIFSGYLNLLDKYHDPEKRHLQHDPITH